MDRSPKAPNHRSSNRRRLPLRKLFLFALVAVVVFWAALEGVLALFHVRPIVDTEDPYVGFVSQLPLFVEAAGAGGERVMRTAPNKLTYFNLQEFPRQKGKNTFRIFTVGGSTTYGHPYTDPTSYSGWLRELLPEIDPSRTWEVINAGGISYASYREAALLEELARYDPDLFVVYTGHNEFLERRTYSGILTANPGVTWLGSQLGRTRTYAVLRAGVGAVRHNPAAQARKQYQMTGEVDALLDATVGLSAYTRDDTLQRQVTEHFRFNLHRMARIARNAGTRILFVTVASNLKDTSPFKSQHTPGLPAALAERSDAQLAAVRRAREAGDRDAAVRLAAEVVAMDPRSAATRYEYGRALFAAGRTAEAYPEFVRARDEDVCPLRQLTIMRQIMLETGARERVPVVDFVQVIEDTMRERYGHPIAGEELFLDHAHPTVEGNGMLAVSLVEAMAAAGLVRPASGWRTQAVPRVAERIESRIDRKMQALALRNLARLFSWAGKTEEAARLARQSYDLDPNEIESLVVLGSKAAAEGDADRAIEYYEQVLAIEPHHLEARNNLAVELSRRGDAAGALRHYEAMLEANPEQPNVHHNAGQACMQLGDWPGAIAHFERVVALRPADASAHTNLGTALVQARRLDEGAASFEMAIRIAPADPAPRLGLGLALERRGRPDEALGQYREAVQRAPESAAARRALGQALLRRGEPAAAERELAEAIRLDPRLPGVHNALGSIRWRERRLDEALVQYEAELEVDPKNIEAKNNKASVLMSQGKAAEALALYREILQQNPADAMTLNSLAWELATHSEAKVRNGKEAVELATRAVQLTERRHPLPLITLAAAQAETGRFTEAAATARESVAAARAQNQAAMARELESVLARFEKGQPYRQPARRR